MLADPYRLEGEGEVAWTAPAVRNPAAVKRVVDELTRGLLPARSAFLKWICDKLSALPTQTSTGLNAAFWTDNVIDTCDHYPEDLLQTATLELLRTKTFRPSPAEIVAIIEPRYGERQRMLERAKSLQAPIDQAAKPFEAEPVEVRLRTLRDGCQRNGHLDRAANYERELAAIEKREPEEWAREVASVTAASLHVRDATKMVEPSQHVGGESKMVGAGAVTRAVMRETARAMEQATIEPWQAGQPVYQRAPEEPPPPTEIPEADVEVEP